MSDERVKELEEQLAKLRYDYKVAVEQLVAFTGHLCTYDRSRWNTFRIRWENELRYNVADWEV